ncbi:MAG: DedA family protein [Patescibacteria group bacterium]|nr:DedA family protein [Patescibacteria group bacterium]MDD5715943.1 DedA family protein [Patescibacteria group bacterium]
MGITELLIDSFKALIDSAGYVGVFILMTLESMVAPVPSEAVMPFTGFLWNDGMMSFWIIVLVSTAGSITGSLISYYIGAYGGRPLVRKFGKFLLLNEHHLDKTEAFFRKYGDKTILISRFIPIVRHLISIPAGVGRMKLGKFAVYTIVGASLWNAFLTWLGYTLGDNWEMIRKYSEVLDIIIIIVIAGAVLYYIRRVLQARNQGKTTNSSAKT